jgi:AcrR family transcriptional regulator
MGYTESSTPLILKRAGTTRGALYQHYADKKAIFRAVLELEAQRVAEEIEASEVQAREITALDRLLLGAGAYLRAMQVTAARTPSCRSHFTAFRCFGNVPKTMERSLG